MTDLLKKIAGRGGDTPGNLRRATSFAPAWGGQAGRFSTGGVTPVHTSKGGGQVPHL